jgi:hypothetical protein
MGRAREGVQALTHGKIKMVKRLQSTPQRGSRDSSSWERKISEVDMSPLKRIFAGAPPGAPTAAERLQAKTKDDEIVQVTSLAADANSNGAARRD